MTGKTARSGINARIADLLAEQADWAIDLDEAADSILAALSDDEQMAIVRSSVRRMLGDACRSNGRVGRVTSAGTVYFREQGEQLQMLTPQDFEALAQQRSALAKPLAADAMWFRVVGETALGRGCAPDAPVETVLSADEIDAMREAVGGEVAS